MQSAQRGASPQGIGAEAERKVFPERHQGKKGASVFLAHEIYLFQYLWEKVWMGRSRGW